MNWRDDLAFDAQGRAHRIIESGADADVASAVKRVYRRLFLEDPTPARVDRRRVAVLCFACALCVLVGLRSMTFPSGRVPGVIQLTMAPIFAWGTWLYIRQKRTLLRWWPIERVRDAWVAEGGCPACGYALPTENESEGIVRCPECGTRWRRAEPGLTP